jgi:hypothetical protein
MITAKYKLCGAQELVLLEGRSEEVHAAGLLSLSIGCSRHRPANAHFGAVAISSTESVTLDSDSHHQPMYPAPRGNLHLD